MTMSLGFDSPLTAASRLPPEFLPLNIFIRLYLTGTKTPTIESYILYMFSAMQYSRKTVNFLENSDNLEIFYLYIGSCKKACSINEQALKKKTFDVMIYCLNSAAKRRSLWAHKVSALFYNRKFNHRLLIPLFDELVELILSTCKVCGLIEGVLLSGEAGVLVGAGVDAVINAVLHHQ